MTWDASDAYADGLKDGKAEAAAEIERLRAALEEIAKHPRGGRIDTPEKLERDEMIGIARAALTAQPAAPGGDA